MSSSGIDPAGKAPDVKDVLVSGYGRVEHGEEEWVNEYWRASPGQKPPLSPEQRKKLINRLEAELRALDETINTDNEKLEADKQAQEDAPFWDKHKYDDAIKADVAKKTVDVNAKTEGENSLNVLKGSH